MSDKIKLHLVIEDKDDWIQDNIEISYNDLFLMLQSEVTFFPEYFDEKKEKYMQYVKEKTQFHYSNDSNEKEFLIEFKYKKE